jgi:tetraacyldisaccharide 4'-kinase
VNPLTGLYGAVVGARNALFDRGVISSRRLALPVVSVGNLSVGGTGKTPFVIALGELLKARGIRFDVLSRGYRRRTRGVRVVEIDGTAADYGDEPLLIARRLGVPVVVGESRYLAGLTAEQKFKTELHILDDGFQHRSLARDFDVVLLTERDFEDRLLPAGRLREPLRSLKRADALVLVKDSSSQQFDVPELATKDFAPQGKLVWRVQRDVVVPSEFKKPVVFCGIARPQLFFSQVRAAGICPSAEVEFRDHHAYGRRDIARLIDLGSKTGADGFLTTEKDSVNLGTLTLQAELNPFAVVRLEMTFDHPTEVVNAIFDRITKRHS